jgi:TPR repeat protein
MYATGSGVQQDDKEAVKLFRMAAEAGDSDAQASLGLAYLAGRGVAKDLQQSYFWLELAAVKGEDIAIKTRDLVAKEMTPAQIAEAKRLAQEWKPK